MSRYDSHKDVLEDYFDGLLLDEADYQSEPVPQNVPVSSVDDVPAASKKIIRKVDAHSPSVAVREEEEVLAVQQREKVSQLLESTLPMPAAEVLPVVEPEQEVLPVEIVEEVNGDVDLHDSMVWLENGLPAWAQGDFDVLLFKVSGLTLAVPLVALGQIYPLTEELTPIFGQAEWFMGLLPSSTGEKIKTVNTALFVMPERYDENFLSSAEYVISINGLSWGLAVDSVSQPVTIRQEDVKWRTQRSKRPWLAGTVKEQMCALIDIPVMGQLLEQANVKPEE